MKKILYVFLFITPLSFGQQHDELYAQLELITDVNRSSFEMDSTGLSDLPLPDYHCTLEQNGIFWHVLDLNHDGRNDLIYSGPCQPYMQSAVFINDGHQMNLAYDAPGKLVDIQTKGTVTTVRFFKESCCCDYYHSYSELSFDSDGKLNEDQIIFHSETQITLDDKIKEETRSGIIRSQPVVNDSIYEDPCLGQRFTGNQIVDFEDEKVYIIASESDWQLVVYREDNEKHLIGWVRK